MSGKRRMLLLIAILTVITLSLVAITLHVLYNTSFKLARSHLVEAVQSQARLIEAVARFDEEYSGEDVEGGAFAATLSQIEEAHGNFSGLGKTGEFTLANLQGDRIVYLLALRHYDPDRLRDISIDSKFAEPMRLALTGNSGTIVGLDYRGKTVLAAYEPVSELNLGIVAKIDLAEIRNPFIRAAELVGGITLVLIILGTIISYRIGYSMVCDIEKNETSFRGAFDQAEEALFIIKENGNILDVNKYACELLDYTRKELLKFSITDIASINSKDKPYQFYQFLNSESSTTIESVFYCKNGTTFPAEIRAGKITNSGRSHALLLARDITDHKRSQEKLRQSERELALRNQIAEVFLSNRDDAIYSKILEIILKSMNCKFGYFGYIDEDGTLVRPSMTRDIRDKCQMPKQNVALHKKIWDRLLGNSMKERKTFCSNEPLNVPDGHVPILKVLLVPIINRGELVGQIAVADKATDFINRDKEILEAIADFIAPILDAKLQRDIEEKERKRAQAKLRESEEKFRRITERLFDVIFLADLNGKISYISPSVKRVFGYHPEELIGKNIAELVSTTEVPPAHEILKLITAEKTVEGYQSDFLKKDSTYAKIETNALPIYKDGIVIGIQAIVRDITETKRLQESASRAQRLETAGRIAGQVAHDFNNLLGPLLAYPSMIKEDLNDDHSFVPLLNDMETAAERMAEINQELLTLSRRGHYLQEALNLNEIIPSVINLLEKTPDSIQIDIDLGKDIMNIKGGASQITRVIMNLVNNSIDAVQDEGRITIKTENYYVDESIGRYGRIPRGEYVKISVTDTGKGISEESLPRIFDPFFTTKATDKRRGSGLGLSVVHAVMEDHDGYIDLESRIDRGTSFYLYFPIIGESVQTSISKEIIGGSERILVVDDDKLQREVSLNLLRGLGYNAIAVESGEKAIEIMVINPQDLLVLDMIMPGGIDGTETYERILEFNPGQKAIIVSEFAETEQVERAIKLGVGAFVRKPLVLDSISATIRAELDKVPA